MGEHVLYTVLARYYDYIYAGYLEKIAPRYVDLAVEAFNKFARREVKEVLDVACGTGGPTLELARRGCKVTGVDLHGEMLEIAREKARREGYDVEFIECDARELDRVFKPGSFDAVTMFFTSLAYMVEWEDLIKLLRSVHYVLRDGGIFYADTPNPHHYMYSLGNIGIRRAITWTAEGPDGETLVMSDWKEIEDWIKPVILFKREIRIIKPDGTTKTYLMSDKLRIYTAQELVLVAKTAGYREAQTLCYNPAKGLQPPSPGQTCGKLYFIAMK